MDFAPVRRELLKISRRSANSQHPPASGSRTRERDRTWVHSVRGRELRLRGVRAREGPPSDSASMPGSVGPAPGSRGAIGSGGGGGGAIGEGGGVPIGGSEVGAGPTGSIGAGAGAGPGPAAFEGGEAGFPVIGTNSPGFQRWGLWRISRLCRKRSAWPQLLQTRVPSGISPFGRRERPLPVTPVLTSFAQTNSKPPQLLHVGATTFPLRSAEQAPGPYRF
jgi:hypothetical protein